MAKFFAGRHIAFVTNQNCWSVFRKDVLKSDSEAFEQYKDAVDKHFTELLQEKPLGWYSQLGRELNIRLLSDMNFIGLSHMPNVYFISFARTFTGNNELKLDWDVNMSFKVTLFGLFVFRLIHLYRNHRMVRYRVLRVLEKVKFLTIIIQVTLGNYMGK